MRTKRIEQRAALAAVCLWVPCLHAASPALAASAPIPNLSGLWGRQSLDLEQPAVGPGPVVNLHFRSDGSSDSNSRVGDYRNPVLNAFAAGVVRQHGEISLRGETYPNPMNQCRPQPTPFVLTQLEMEVLQGRDEVTILYMIDHQVRHIRLNAAHPAHVVPSWSGDSVGHYEGDTLVVDTVAQKVGPFSMVDQYGTPFTKSLHVVERYRLIDGRSAIEAERRNEKEHGSAMGRFADFDNTDQGLEIGFTVEDAGAFSKPWSAKVTFLRGRAWLEYICAESPFDYATGRNPQLPKADIPDF